MERESCVVQTEEGRLVHPTDPEFERYAEAMSSHLSESASPEDHELFEFLQSCLEEGNQ